MLRSWRTRSTSDISWLYLMVLTIGVSMWAVYGVFRSDPVIIITNVVTVLFMTFLMTLKLAERRSATTR
jgi:MtN3 and saliva related transmembrane protein